ncbi:MAG: hypothetical protein L3J83_11730, partial [Proteobacteria bacterium]|nr:hypothetical protein [Pseudomonadota bacterium]
MKKTVGQLFLVIALLYSIDSYAGVGVIDLEITLEHQPLDNLNFGDIGQFSVTLTNHGPDEAGANSPVEKPIPASVILEVVENIGIPVDFAQDNSQPQECDFLLSFVEPRPPNPLVLVYEFYYPPIPAGESISCYGLFLVLFNSGSRDIEWFTTYGLFGPSGSGDIDPNPDNNFQTMNFGIQPIAVPTLSFYTLFIFSMLVFFVGYISIRKKHLYA